MMSKFPRKNIIVLSAMIFILISVNSFCMYLTASECENEYNMSLYGSPAKGYCITGIDASAGDIIVNKDNAYFNVNVYIDAEVFSGDKTFENIKKSERIEKINGRDVAIIEFLPLLVDAASMNPIRYQKIQEKFTYKLEPYAYGELTYILRCGEFEKVINISYNK